MKKEGLDLMKMDMGMRFAPGTDRIIAASFGGSIIDDPATPENKDHAPNDAPGID